MVGDCDRSGAASRESQASARSQEYYPPRGDGKLGSCLLRQAAIVRREIPVPIPNTEGCRTVN